MFYLNVDLYNVWVVYVVVNGCEENSILEVLELLGVVVYIIDEYGIEIVYINYVLVVCLVDFYNFWCFWYIYILDNYDV